MKILPYGCGSRFENLTVGRGSIGPLLRQTAVCRSFFSIIAARRRKGKEKYTPPPEICLHNILDLFQRPFQRLFLQAGIVYHQTVLVLGVVVVVFTQGLDPDARAV